MLNAMYLVDAGEGSVRQLLEAGMPLQQVERICITHLHGDHCFGLGGVLRQVATARHAALGPSAPPLHIYGPPNVGDLILASIMGPNNASSLPIRVVITELVTSPAAAHPPHPVDAAAMVCMARMAPSTAPNIPALQAPQQLTQAAERLLPRMPRTPNDPNTNPISGAAWYIPCDNGATIAAAQLQHRVACWGYAFQEPPSNLPRQRKVVILGDTMDSSAMAPLAWQADVLSHEATFNEGMEPKARIAQHSTGWMAGLFAARVQARHLVLTHFSARYEACRFNTYGSGARRGGPGGGGMDSEELSAEEEQAMQLSAVAQLIAEAKSTYGSPTISAAHDFFTVHVPLPQPPPFTNMHAVMQWAAAAELARIALPHLSAAATSIVSC